jgi:hypothetical protein
MFFKLTILKLILNNSKRFHYNLENSNSQAGIPGLGKFLIFTIRGRPNAYQLIYLADGLIVVPQKRKASNAHSSGNSLEAVLQI